MTDHPQSGPPERADAGSEPAGDVPAALGPDAPTDVSPVAPPPPPPAIAAVCARRRCPRCPSWRPEDDLSSGGPAAVAAERPELAVGAAFAGGLVLALILKRLAR